jgi:hypothetical protein
MYVCYPRIANLSQELPYVLVSCPSILSYEISKVRYPKTPWVGHHVKVFGGTVSYTPWLTLSAQTRAYATYESLAPSRCPTSPR